MIADHFENENWLFSYIPAQALTSLDTWSIIEKKSNHLS